MSERKTGVEPEIVGLWKSKMEELAECPARKEAVSQIYKILFGNEKNPEITGVEPQQPEIDGFIYYIRRHVDDIRHNISIEVEIASSRTNYRRGAQMISTPNAIGNTAFLLVANEVLKQHGFVTKFYSWPENQCFKCGRVTSIEYGIDVGFNNVRVFVTEDFDCKCKR